MTAQRWRLQVDRVTVRAADVAGLDAAALRAELTVAIEAAVGSAPLPVGRAAAATVVHRAGALAAGGRGALVTEVATGIARAVSGSGRHG